MVGQAGGGTIKLNRREKEEKYIKLKKKVCTPSITWSRHVNIHACVVGLKLIDGNILLCKFEV